MRLPRPCLILLMALNAAALSTAQVKSYTDDAVVQYAKSIDIAKLDSTLASQRLEDWLLRGPARIDELNWYVSRNCDLKYPKPDADGDLPLCVKVGFRRGNITGFGVLRVGTLKRGVSGQPAFEYLDVFRPTPVGSYDKLSNFPGYLDSISRFQTPSDTKTEPALQLTVRTDQQSYRMSDTIKMETQVLNTGSEDVYIWEWDFCWNFARGLSMYVTTPEGTAVQGDFLFDCVPPPPKEGNVYAFIKLEPGRLYGIADGIKVTDIVSKPGEYDISVIYSSKISRSFIKEFLKHDPISTLPVWTMEQPAVNAPKVRIIVKP